MPSLDSLVVVHADSPARIADARALLQEYAASIADTACVEGFEKEIADLPGAYGPPSGAILLAYAGASAAGCVCMRELSEGACEMKRLYVRAPHRSTGAGRALVAAIIETARGMRYRLMRLDTLPFMTRAIDLYRRFGFVAIDPYGPGAGEGAMFFELTL